ncbi:MULTISPECIES: hypothetical protein [unclassified Gilliamella]|uniref:hypothetical protein n=1 Tax=unclassified Gilliamella TaxID=2685620 RepID=UPI001324FAD9|nr:MULTISPECIES: hypothetical protein [unclassified Gilliamella]MWN32889.1 hypothetical protein [Gilliamella sp. Pra-s60]MWP30329.1 hypothetical protein [Gilliamella sp. Pra-s54]
MDRYYQFYSVNYQKYFAFFLIYWSMIVVQAIFFTCLCSYTNSFSHSLFPLFLPFLFAALIGIMYQAIAENFLDEHLEIFYDDEKITFISSKLGKKEFLFSQIKFFAIYRNKGAFASISFSIDIQEDESGPIKKIRYINHKFFYHDDERKQSYDIVHSFMYGIGCDILLWQYDLIKDEHYSNSRKRTYRLTKIYKRK